MRNILNDEEYEIVPLGEIVPGDEIISGSPNGSLTTTVLSTSPITIPKEMYLIEDEDGVESRVSGDHLFYVETSIDLENHSRRVYLGSKILKKFLELEDVKHFFDYPAEEVSLYQIEKTFEKIYSKEIRECIRRVLLSVGPTSYEDGLNGNPVFLYKKEAVYNQLISIRNKRYDSVIIGRVITASEIAEIVSAGIEVKIPSPRI